MELLLHRMSRKVRRDKKRRETLERLRLARKRREIRAVVILGCILAAFLLCWSPFYLLRFLRGVVSFRVPDALFDAATWLGYANSLLNPIIYVLIHKDFRRAYQQLLLRKANRTPVVEAPKIKVEDSNGLTMLQE